MKKIILTFCLFLSLAFASMFADFNITVRALDVPEFSELKQLTDNSVLIEFDSFYEDVVVYRKTEATNWKKVATVDCSWDEQYYIDKNLKSNTKYYYKLASYDSEDNEVGTYTAVKSVMLKKNFLLKSNNLIEPELDSISSISATSIKLEFYCWEDTYIYRKTSNTDWKIIATVGLLDSEYVDNNLTPNTKYYYKLISFEHSYLYDCKLYSDFSDTKSCTTKSPQIKNVSATPKIPQILNLSAIGNYKSINLKWSKKSDVTGYKIYMATSKNGKYSLVKTIANNKTISYKKTGLTINKKYYFKICGYKTISKKNYTGPFSTIVSAKVKKLSYPSKVQLQGYYRSVDVYWEPVSCADGYQIYMSTTKTGKYKCIKSISKQTSSSATIKNLKNLTNYYIKIRSYDKVSGKKVYSDFTKITKIKTISKKASDIKRTIRITKPIISEMNFLGGVDFEIYWRNQSSKKN